MNNKTMSTLNIGNNSYEIKDAFARQKIEEMNNSTTEMKDKIDILRDDYQTVTESTAQATKLAVEAKENTDRIYTDVLKFLPIDTASGSVASFPDGADDIPLKSLVVDINPVQSGRTGMTVNASGKNLFDSNFSDYTKPYDYYIRPIKLESGKRYVVKAELVGTAVTGTAFGITKKGDRYIEFVPYLVLTTSGTVTKFEFTVDDTFTSPKLIAYASGQAKFDEAMNNYNITLEVKANQNNYEPYNGVTIPISFGREIQNGTLDVLTGILTDTDTQTEYQIEAHEVKSMLGQNNIFADCGNVSVEYRANTTAYINRKIAEAINKEKI